jgi:hypothetical protein
MRQLIIYILLLLFAVLPFESCTNDETDDGLETITPNDQEETGKVIVVKMPGSDNSD